MKQQNSMKKTYRLFLALVLMSLGAMNASAQEEISLEEVPFWTHTEWGLNEAKDAPATAAWAVGEPTGLPYGDGNVINFADLSIYSKLVITYTEGTPRVMLNRDIDEGQYNADESQSHLIEYPKGGWESKYFSDADGVLTVDIKQIVKDKGYAHLHAIKGANWANVNVTSMVVVKEGKAKQVGWVNLINNSNMEGDDVSSFFTKVSEGEPLPSVITDGVGVDGSRGIKVEATAKVANPWDNQFWFRFNEPLPAGAKYRVSFDYRADQAAAASTQAHAEPSDYIHNEMFGNINFTSDWATFATEGEVSAQQSTAEKQFLSVAFNLSEFADANNYYFDNIKFEVYKYGTTAEFSNDVILVDFGFDTNIPELVKAGGKTRAFFPNECATVKVNGKEAAIYSIEGLRDGRFYIFLQEPASESDEVGVIFKNPAGDMNIKYAGSPNAGESVADVDEIADLNNAIEENEGYPFDFVTPILVKADPENGSFNLPEGLNEFKVTFDKNVDVEKLEATVDGKKLTVSPATGFAEDVVLKLDGTLEKGAHTMVISKIYPQLMIAEEVYGDTTYVFSTGPSDPTDVPYDVIPASYFNSTAAGSVPEGFLLIADGGEQRVPGGNYGSGARMMDFAAGGDFTKGMYMRTYYMTYGNNDEEHVLTLEAGKKYNLSFNSCQWAGAGHYMKVQVADESDNEVFAKVVENNPNVNEKRDAVKNSTFTSETFTVPATGKYVLNFIVAKNADGEPTENDWQNGVILANVKLSYVPAAAGGAEMAAVAEALENAKATFNDNNAERYDGEALSALNAAITKVEAERNSYTSPSVCTEAVELLTSASTTLKDHVGLCNSYDTQIKAACDVVRQNRENKFAKLPQYEELTTVVAKYNATSEWVNVAEPGEGEEEVEPVWQLQYSYDELKDDALLTTAIADLTDIVNITSHVFTEGGSEVGHDRKLSTGTAVLVERLRLGAETLKSLGRGEDDYVVASALNALTDDDALAEMVKNNIKLDLYGQLKNADNKLFAEVVTDEELGTVETPVYDMTTFFKNPNTYQLGAQVYNEEMVPGWVVPEGFNAPGLTSGWSQHGTDKWATDCMFQTYNSSYRIEQTVNDLPAGVYKVMIGFGEREGSGNEEQAATNLEDCFAYAKTSATEEGTDGFTVDAKVIGQSFPYAGKTNDLVIEGIAVTDGKLTVGVNAGSHSHTFFNDIKVVMTAPAAGFNYGGAYDEVATGAEAAVAAKVMAVQLFDLNGRQVPATAKGLLIVKKTLSDGTVKVEKVIR